MQQLVDKMGLSWCQDQALQIELEKLDIGIRHLLKMKIYGISLVRLTFAFGRGEPFLMAQTCVSR